MEKFVETITLTRESYDALVNEIGDLKTIREKLSDSEKELKIEKATLIAKIEKFKDVIWEKFANSNKYYFESNHSSKKFMEAFNKRISKDPIWFDKDFAKTNELLGYEFIKEKVEKYYDTISEKPKD